MSRPSDDSGQMTPVRTRASLALVLGAVAFATAMLGGGEIWAVAVLGGVTLLAFVLRFVPPSLPTSVPTESLWRRPETYLFGLLGLATLQLVPLPPTVLGIVSPAARAWRESALPSGETLGWAPLSLAPFATHVELYRLATLTLVFVLLARGTTRTHEAIWFFRGVVTIGGLVAVLTLVEHVGGVAIFDYLPREIRYRDRAAGPFVNPNHLAGLLAVTALTGVGLFLALTEDPRRSVGRTLRETAAQSAAVALSRPAALGVLLAVGAMVATLFLTASRLGVLAFLVGLAIAGILLARGRRARGPLVLLGAAVVVTVGLSAVLAADPVLGRIAVALEGASLGGNRPAAIVAALRLGLDFPLFGAGLGTFEHVFPAYQPIGLPGSWQHAHNDLAQAFAGGGLVAVALGVSFTLSWAVRVVRASRSGSLRRRGVMIGATSAGLAVLVHGTGDFNLHVPGNAYLVMAVLGAGLGAARRGVSPGSEER